MPSDHKPFDGNLNDLNYYETPQLPNSNYKRERVPRDVFLYGTRGKTGC